MTNVINTYARYFSECAITCVRPGEASFFTSSASPDYRKVYILGITLYNMRKIVKTLGSGIGIYFTTDDRITYNIKKGDIIDITITRVDKEVEDE